MAARVRVEVQLLRTIISTVLSYPVPVHEEVNYQLHDSKGKLAFSKGIIMVNANGTVQEHLDVSHLAAGTYELTIAAGGKILERKSVII